MLCIINKQAQYLTQQDDRSLTQPYRPMGRFVKQRAREIQQERQRRRWSRYYQQLEGMRDPENGMCEICNQPLVKVRNRRFCPSQACNMQRPRMPSMPRI
jgi:hypothetical protein